MKIYFVYDPEGNGYQEFQDKGEAQDFAEMCVQDYIDDEWDESAVEQIVMGEVYYKAKKTDVEVRPLDQEIDEDGFDSGGGYWEEGWDYKCNYKMTYV